MWYVNGIKYTLSDTQRAQVLIDTVTQLGYDIPRFCYHENLKIAGNCRMRLIEDSKAPKPVICCAGNANPDLQIFTNTIQVKKSRESVMEFLLINHPLDCPICDQGGECDPQDLALVYGSDHGRFYDYKRNVEDKNCGPVVKMVMNRCILCTRCVRYSNDIAGFSTFGLTGRGGKMEIGSYIEKVVNTELSGNLIDVCPVGALTSKPYAFVARPWEIKKISYISILDDQPQLVCLDVKENEIIRILPAKNATGRNIWLTNRTRFSYEGLIRNRFLSPSIFGLFANWEVLLVTFKKLFDKVMGRLVDINTPLVLVSVNNPLGFFDALMLKSFLSSISYGTFSALNDNLIPFLFLPRLSSVQATSIKNYLFSGIDLALDAPIFSLALTQQLSLKNGFIASWRSVIPTVLMASKIALGNTISVLFNFLSFKTWVNQFIKVTESACFAELNIFLFISQSQFKTFPITNTLNMRTLIDLDLTSLSPTNNYYKPLYNLLAYKIGNNIKSNNSLVTMAHLTHSIKFQTAFMAPLKALFEINDTYYDINFSSFKINTAVAHLETIKSIKSIISIISEFFNLKNLFQTKLSFSLPMKLIKNPFLFSDSRTYRNFFSVPNDLYVKPLTSQADYYQAQLLLTASPTVSSLYSNSNILINIY